MFDKTHAFSATNSGKFAMVTIAHIPPNSSWNRHTLINKFIFNLRPSNPKLKRHGKERNDIYRKY